MDRLFALPGEIHVDYVMFNFGIEFTRFPPHQLVTGREI